MPTRNEIVAGPPSSLLFGTPLPGSRQPLQTRVLRGDTAIFVTKGMLDSFLSLARSAFEEGRAGNPDAILIVEAIVGRIIGDRPPAGFVASLTDNAELIGFSAGMWMLAEHLTLRRFSNAYGVKVLSQSTPRLTESGITRRRKPGGVRP